jgi:hypothetical protein
MDNDLGAKAASSIRSVINADEEKIYFEYHCHSPDIKRWFMTRVTPFTILGGTFFVISHQNITERKMAE